MNEEELKQKCKERAKIFQQAMESCHSSSPIDCIEWFADRIAELEMTVGILRTFSNEQATCIERLKAQIEKMKRCEICKYKDDLALSDWSPCNKCDGQNWELTDD